jgi:hypothetical protein
MPSRCKMPVCLPEVRATDVAGPIHTPLEMHELLGNEYFRSALAKGPPDSEGLEGHLDATALGTCESDAWQEDAPALGDDSVGSGGGVQLLVGGPYTGQDGTRHRYGHTAVRVYDGTGERDVVYDFGRYGDTHGDYSAEGEGIMRVWDGTVDDYLDSQHATGRETMGYTFPATPEEVARAFERFDGQLSEAEERTVEEGAWLGDSRREFKMPQDYHGIHNNCTTVSVDALEHARPDIDLDVAEQNQGRGLNTAERLAATGIEGWNDEIFMPADLAAVLEDRADDEVLVERWDPTARRHEVLNDPGMTCPDPGVSMDGPRG